MEPQNSSSLQLIDQQKNFIPQALTQILTPLQHCDKDYFTIAIIGSQNTGKSTLLNYLFGTNFKVLEGLAGTRTTRGIILGKDRSTNLVIMDVQGNDSYENHLEGDENYQRMTSSFALVAANLLIVNIHEKQLGQHTGSQYQTLSIVLRICIDQFKQQSPKTVLFCLRDANPNYTDEGQCRRKLQADMQKIWKNVWTGTKKAAEFEKYESSPERFFTLQVAFLREFDKDYPEDFIEDVKKLRERFVNPQNDGYLFRKQKKDYNVPASDMPLLLSNIWTTLTTNKELNLPSQKIQLANYRCEQIYFQLQKRFEQDLLSKATQPRNYGQFLNSLTSQFKQKTSSYSKQITDKWQHDISQNFKPKLNKVILQLLQSKQKEIQQHFVTEIKENIFYEQQHTFKEEALKEHEKAVEQFVQLIRTLNYQVESRKELLEIHTNKLTEHFEEEVKDKLVHIQEEFQKEGKRTMCMLAANILRDYFGLELWNLACAAYREKANQLLKELGNRYYWARGSTTSSNQLDENEDKLYSCLINELKHQFETNLSERLHSYFKHHFNYDQHDSLYNFNAMEESKISERYAQAKEMTAKLLETLNNFTFTLTKRSSFICTEDFAGNENKPFLEANKMLAIRESFEHKANEEFYTVIRRKKEALSKKTPLWLILVIIFFMYDDIPSPIENQWLFKLLGFLLVLGAIPFAFGQGHVVTQLLNSGAQMVSKTVSGAIKKVTKSKE